jgi:hypothetical protein
MGTAAAAAAPLHGMVLTDRVHFRFDMALQPALVWEKAGAGKLPSLARIADSVDQTELFHRVQIDNQPVKVGVDAIEDLRLLVVHILLATQGALPPDRVHWIARLAAQPTTVFLQLRHDAAAAASFKSIAEACQHAHIAMCLWPAAEMARFCAAWTAPGTRMCIDFLSPFGCTAGDDACTSLHNLRALNDAVVRQREKPKLQAQLPLPPLPSSEHVRRLNAHSNRASLPSAPALSDTERIQLLNALSSQATTTRPISVPQPPLAATSPTKRVFATAQAYAARPLLVTPNQTGSLDFQCDWQLACGLRFDQQAAAAAAAASQERLVRIDMGTSQADLERTIVLNGVPALPLLAQHDERAHIEDLRHVLRQLGRHALFDVASVEWIARLVEPFGAGTTIVLQLPADCVSPIIADRPRVSATLGWTIHSWKVSELRRFSSAMRSPHTRICSIYFTSASQPFCLQGAACTHTHDPAAVMRLIAEASRAPSRRPCAFTPSLAMHQSYLNPPISNRRRRFKSRSRSRSPPPSYQQRLR